MIIILLGSIYMEQFVENKLSKRFSELSQQAESLLATRKTSHSEMLGSSENVDGDLFLEWRVKVKNLLIKVAGENSEHYKQFCSTESNSSWGGSIGKFKSLKAVFNAAKEDFDGGYMTSYKSIVQAEVFDSELEQASELLRSGYYVASAVIAGTVLETSLRELCDRENIPHSKMDKMNADLTKAAVYNKIVQKQITALAGIRNSAAHGSTEEFSKTDVEQMINSIEQFLANHLD